MPPTDPISNLDLPNISSTGTAGQTGALSGTLAADTPERQLGSGGVAGARQDLQETGRLIVSKAERLWEELGQNGTVLVSSLGAATDQAYREFIQSLGSAKLTPEETDDVQWAFSAMATVGVRAIGADPEEAKRLQQLRKDALSVMADITACKLHDGEKALTMLVSRIFALAQDFILRGVSVAVAAAL